MEGASVPCGMPGPRVNARGVGRGRGRKPQPTAGGERDSLSREKDVLK